MTFKDINKKLTETVAGLMMDGYTINAGTMDGTQGEVAKIDMTDGDEIIRVLVDDFYEREHPGLDGVRIIVGRCTSRCVANDKHERGGILWNNELEIISEEKFYKIDGEWYGTQTEARAANIKRYERYCNNKSADSRNITSEKTIDIVLPLVRRECDIKRVERGRVEVFKMNPGKFVVFYRDNRIALS